MQSPHSPSTLTAHLRHVYTAALVRFLDQSCSAGPASCYLPAGCSSRPRVEAELVSRASPTPSLPNMGQKPLAVGLLNSGLRTSYRPSVSCLLPASQPSHLCFSLYQLWPAHPTASTPFVPSCAPTHAIPGSLACPARTDVWKAASATPALSLVVSSASPGPSVGALIPQAATSW